MKTKQNKKKNLQKTGNIVVSVVACFVVFFAFSAFAIDFAYVIATRAKLQSATDATALIAAPYYINSGGEPTPYTYFAQHKVTPLKYANIKNINIKRDAKAVMVETECNAPVFFLSALGVHYVKIQAKSSAQVTPQEMQLVFFSWPYHYQYISQSLITNKPGHDFSLKKLSSDHKIETYVGLSSTQWLKISPKDVVAGTYYYDLSDIGVTQARHLKVINVRYLSTYPAPPLRLSDVTVTNPVALIKNSTFNSL